MSIKLHHALQICETVGVRCLEQRGFYSHFLRIIYDGRELRSVTININEKGRISVPELRKALS